ncbi:S26 family signal peptidase [Asticcacaulis machinosus]|uniref:S26 family signal peptidase n=1 Tax=Asticcacaulis machinosus TaxID=2984211 RepID=A0ABT5HGZ5_9CAUL|nr:S26 family signal peptidase [Asticcacaulis machinosus]MDC7675516.1 S26 family signal peptidase [Asticcacaulis machinosus]
MAPSPRRYRPVAVWCRLKGLSGRNAPARTTPEQSHSPADTKAKSGPSQALQIAALATGAIVLIGLSASLSPVPRLIFNPSASVARGLYTNDPNGRPRRYDLLLVRLPEAIAQLADARRYLPTDIPLIKPVAAIAGDDICRHHKTVFVNGAPVAVAKLTDRYNRPLPQWQGCRRLRTGQVLLISPAMPDSFDGRYFGPVSSSYVLGVVRPLIVETDHPSAQDGAEFPSPSERNSVADPGNPHVPGRARP